MTIFEACLEQSTFSIHDDPVGFAADSFLPSSRNWSTSLSAASMTLSTPGGNTLLTSEIKGGYILPGITRRFEPAGSGSRVPGGPAKLHVTQDDGSKQVFDVQLVE